MRYNIYRGAAIVAANIYLEGSVTERIMGEETANVSFSSPTKIEFHIGDRVQIFQKDYNLSAEPAIVKVNSREFRYIMIFFSIKYSLADTSLFFYDDDNELTLPDFSIMGNAATCLDVVLANANRTGNGWTAGTVDATDVKNVSFSDANCLSGISQIADAFDLEYWIDSDKSIHFTERKPVSGYSFEYGKAKGLKNITRTILEGGSLVTRLFVKGSEKNLPKNYRGGQKNLRIDVPFLEKNIDIYGQKEHTESFPEIYPKRLGTVTKVYAGPNRFTDADIDFDLNAFNAYGTTVLLNGVAAKIIFQTGQLAGYRIELIEAGGYNSATKTFYLNPVKDEKDLEIPSDLLRPAVGDTYIIEDIMMPESYVLAAEAELKQKGKEYIDQNSKERFQYAAEADPLYFKNQNINIVLGSTVHFKDLDFSLDEAIRVTGLVRNVQNGYEVNFDLSEVTVVSSIIKSYYEQQEQQTTMINSIKYSAELARRNYLFGREFHEKVFDGEGYFDTENIKPLSIETKMLTVGSRLQQFGLPGVDFKIVTNNSLTNTAGKIVHQTIDEDAIREWEIPANSVIGISADFNYIFIKCQKVGTNANFLVTEEPIKVDEDPDFYHFEVGYLSSIIDGYRKIKTTYGFAQLNPAELSIGRVSDPTGNNFIDLLQDKIAIKAKVEFTADSPAIGQINSQLQVGGRNHYRKSTVLSNYDNIALSRNTAETPYGFSCTGLPSATNTIRLEDVIKSDGFWTVSFDMRGSQAAIVGVTVDICGLGGQKFFTTPDDAWQRHKLTVDVNNLSGMYNYVAFTDFDWAYFFIKNIKIERGVTATDFTLAPEDFEEEVAFLEDMVLDLNQEISDFSDDNILSPQEKQILKTNYDAVLSEYSILIAQAGQYNISTVNYEAKYNALFAYVTSSGIFIDLSEGTPILGATFRNNFKDYYAAKVALVKVITDTIKVQLLGLEGEMAAQTANVMELEEKTDFLTTSAVAGNAIATGSLIVGNGEGANAGITGLGGLLDIFLWGGTTFANRANAPISLSRDGFLRVRNGAGQVIFEFGQQNGDAVFNIFSKLGIKVAEIGDSGIQFINYVAESYSPTSFLYLTNQNDGLPGDNARESEVLSRSRTLLDLGDGTYRHRLQGSTINSYTYNAGYNFESAMNSQYQGIYFDSENKLGGRLPNGYYVFDFNYIISQTPVVTLSLMIVRIMNGGVISSKTVNANRPWADMFIF